MSSNEPCTQPDCLLQDEGVDARYLAELMVRVLAGEDVSYVMAGKTPIDSYERCVGCALRIQAGAGPLPTVDEMEDLLQAGRWSHRRARRGAKREKRNAED